MPNAHVEKNSKENREGNEFEDRAEDDEDDEDDGDEGGAEQLISYAQDLGLLGLFQITIERLKCSKAISGTGWMGWDGNLCRH